MTARPSDFSIPSRNNAEENMYLKKKLAALLDFVGLVFDSEVINLGNHLYHIADFQFFDEFWSWPLLML